MNKFFALSQIISLGCFLILFVGKTIYLRRKAKISAVRINIFTREGTRHKFEIVMFSLVNLWIFTLLLYALDDAFNALEYITLPKLLSFDILFLKIAGIFIIITGFIIFGLALFTLGNSWRLGIDDKNPGKLVTNGIYSISRHPIYLFFDLYFLGIFLVSSNFIFLIFAVFLGIIMHYQLLREERFLVRTFGIHYTDYMKNVGRYFNFRYFFNRNNVKYSFKFEKIE